VTIETVIHAILEVKSLNVVRFALPAHDLVDDVILATAQNSVHLNAVVQAAQKVLGKSDSGTRLSGKPESGWMIFDGGSFVLHVLIADVRELYDLDHLFMHRGGVAYHH
jgi:ribosomal silencing factor RsfS